MFHTKVHEYIILYICHTHSSMNILWLDQIANLYVYNIKTLIKNLN